VGEIPTNAKIDCDGSRKEDKGGGGALEEMCAFSG